MSTPVFVDPEISTQADEAQSSRVPVPLPEDPYEAIRQAYLDGTDIKTARMAVRVPPAMSSGLSASMAEVAAMSESVFLEDAKEDDDQEDEEIEKSLDSDSVTEDAEDEGPTAEDEDPAAGDEGLPAGDEGLEEEEAVAEGQQQAVLIVETAVSAPLGLGSAPEPERPESVSASRQPTLTTWTDPEDGMVYIDVPAYPPPAPPRTPVATPATAETEGFLTELGAQVEMQRGLIRDHARATCAWPLSDTHGERTRSCWVTAAEERQARYMLAKNIATEGG
ncbi:hypothetical protein Tco_0738724 [Tanacetum coccineum]